MKRILVLLTILFALGAIAVHHDVFGDSDCDPSCTALQQTDRSTPVQGIEYQLDSPDLWVDRTACEDTAVSAGWLVANTLEGNKNHEWVEAGITKGDFRNVGCVTLLRTYYAVNNVYDDDNPVYQEYLAPNGRVDPGDDIMVLRLI